MKETGRNQSKRVKREGSAQSLNVASRSCPHQQEQGIAACSVESVPCKSKTLQCAQLPVTQRYGKSELGARGRRLFVSFALQSSS